MDCKSASAADCVRDCGEGVQRPNERKPIFFMQYKSPISYRRYGCAPLLWVALADGRCIEAEKLGERGEGCANAAIADKDMEPTGQFKDFAVAVRLGSSVFCVVSAPQPTLAIRQHHFSNSCGGDALRRVILTRQRA